MGALPYEELLRQAIQAAGGYAPGAPQGVPLSPGPGTVGSLPPVGGVEPLKQSLGRITQQQAAQQAAEQAARAGRMAPKSMLGAGARMLGPAAAGLAMAQGADAAVEAGRPWWSENVSNPLLDTLGIGESQATDIPPNAPTQAQPPSPQPTPQPSPQPMQGLQPPEGGWESQKQFQGALATKYPATQKPVESSPGGLGMTSAKEAATQAMIAQLTEDEDRRTSVQDRMGPGINKIGESGTREFAPGQFYSGPDRVGGTARKDSFSNRPGSVNLPPTSSGKGTLSMMQGNEILPSNPRAKRDYMLEKAQQNAAIAQAEAAKEAYEQRGQSEPQPPEDEVANLLLQGMLDKYREDGDIEAFTNNLSQLFQTMRRFSPDQIYAFPGAASPTE